MAMSFPMAAAPYCADVAIVIVAMLANKLLFGPEDASLREKRAHAPAPCAVNWTMKESLLAQVALPAEVAPYLADVTIVIVFLIARYMLLGPRDRSSGKKPDLALDPRALSWTINGSLRTWAASSAEPARSLAEAAVRIVAMLVPRRLFGKRPRPARIQGPEIIAEAIARSMKEGVSQAALSAQLNWHLLVCNPDCLGDMLADLLEHFGQEGTTPELLAAVRGALGSWQIKLEGRLLDLAMRAHYDLGLQGEIDEVVAEVGGVGDVPNDVALLSSQAALRSSGLQAALASMETYARQWQAEFAEHPSAAAQSILLEVLSSALDQDKSAEVLWQFDTCGLLTPTGAPRAGDELIHCMMIKAQLQAGQPQAARATLEAMKAARFELGSSTFNEFIDAAVDLHNAWELVGEMEAHGLAPDKITVTMLFRRCERESPGALVARTLALMDSVEEAMDEILLNAACKAFIRLKKWAWITRLLARQRSDRPVPVTKVGTFLTLIHAFGYIKDVRGMWCTWNLLLTQCQPTRTMCLTMLDALLSNKQVEAAYQFHTALRLNPETRWMISVKSYTRVVKSFTENRRFHDVYAVYKEMLAEKIELDTCAFNGLVHAWIQDGKPAHTHGLMEEVLAQNVTPDAITYNYLINSYCQNGEYEKAFEMFVDTKAKRSDFLPHEYIYSNLLCHCVCNGFYEKGITLLELMQVQGLEPSRRMRARLENAKNRSSQRHATHAAGELCRAVNNRPAYTASRRPRPLEVYN